MSTSLFRCLTISVKFAIVCISLLSYLTTHSQWTPRYHGLNQNNEITGISMLTPQQGFIAFADFVGYTADSGRSFTRRYVTNGNVLYNGYYPNLTFGFMIKGVTAFTSDSLLLYGHYGTEPAILFSANQGQTWKLVFHKNIRLNASEYNQGITDMVFPGNSSRGYAIHHDEIIRTTNRGQSWHVIYFNVEKKLAKLDFIDQNTGFAIGEQVIYKTVDGGNTWLPLPTPTGSIRNIDFLTSSIGYINTGLGSVFRTEDGGNSWSKTNQEDINFVIGQEMVFVNDSTGYICGQPYVIYVTTNQGKTWEPARGSNQHNHPGGGYNALFFYDENFAWSGGDGEYLVFTENGGKATYPKSLFKTDITGVSTTGEVKLVNYSKTNYSYKWYRDGALFSTGYNASYLHVAGDANDEIKLIVSNGVDSDTSIQTIYFPNTNPDPLPLPYTGWVTVNTGLTEDLLDVQFWSNKGMVIGSDNIYFTTTGGNGINSWNKLVITGNTQDSLLFARCRFVRMASKDSGQVYMCGSDTVDKKAILFYYNMNASTYAFKYIGAVNTRFNALAHLTRTDIITAVGDNGLMLRHQISTSANTILPAFTSANFYDVSQRYAAGGIIVMTDSVMYEGSPDPTAFALWNTYNTGMKLRGVSSHSVAQALAMSDSKVVGYHLMVGTRSSVELDVMKQGLNYKSIAHAGNGLELFVGTDKGIYKGYFKPGFALEYQPTSMEKPINRIWFRQTGNTHEGYAVGAAGTLLKTMELGGPTIPMARIWGSEGGCPGQNIEVVGYKGSATICRWFLDNKYLTECFDGYYRINRNDPGQYTLKFVTGNVYGLYDTAIKVITVNPPPVIDLPVQISDSILCKSESTTIGIKNTESGITYELRRTGDTTIYGAVMGNGNLVLLTTKPLSVSGQYYISAKGIGGYCVKDFTNRISITVEKTKSKFSWSAINATANENLTYYQNSTDAQHYLWKFGADASLSESNLASPAGIKYSSTGQKQATLISWSDNGCYDTITANSVYIYDKPTANDSCYTIHVNSTNYYYQYGEPLTTNQMVPTKDGFLVCGSGLQQEFKSKYGLNLGGFQYGGLYVAKYSNDGALKWVDYGVQHNFADYPFCEISSCVSDADGNIYITGICNNFVYFYSNNGDSVRLSRTDYPHGKYNGFIAKLNPDGVLVWRVALEDHTPATGASITNVRGVKIQLDSKGNLLVAGGFGGRLSWYKDGVSTQLYNLSGSGGTAEPIRGFLIKLDTSGNYKWSTYNENPKINLGIDNKDNIYLNGNFDNGYEFHSTDGSVTTGSLHGIAGNYVIKYNNAGNVIWHTHLRGVRSRAMVIDSVGNIYLGQSGGPLDSSESLSVINADGSVDYFSLSKLCVIKLNSAGIYQWAVGSKYTYYGGVDALALHNNLLTVTGTISDRLNQTVQVKITSSLGNEVDYSVANNEFLLLQYDTAGVLKRVANSGVNVGGTIVPNSVIIAENNDIIISGNVNYYAGGNNHFNVFNNDLEVSGSDGFVAKISSSLCGSSTVENLPDTDNFKPEIVIYNLEDSGNSDIRVYTRISDYSKIDTSYGNKPKIYYRNGRTGNWQKSDGKFISGSLKYGNWVFPAQISALKDLKAHDTIFYFIAAQESVNPIDVGTAPAGNVLSDVNTILSSAYYSYYVIKDNAPIVTHAEIANPQLYEPVSFEARIMDRWGIETSGNNSPRIFLVVDNEAIPVLYDTLFGVLKSGNNKDGIWEFKVPNEFLKRLRVGQPFKYFIFCKDSSQNISSYPNVHYCGAGCNLWGEDNYVFRNVADSIGPVITYLPLSEIQTRQTSYTISNVIISDTTKPDTTVGRPLIYFKVGKNDIFIQSAGTLTKYISPFRSEWNFTITPANLLNIGDTVFYFIVAQDVNDTPNVRSASPGLKGTSVYHLQEPPSIIDYFIVGRPTGLSEVSTLEGVDLVISPNPNNGNFYYKLSGAIRDKVNISIVRPNGDVVYRKHLGFVYESYSGWVNQIISKGMYFLKVETPKGYIVGKLLVQ